MICEICKCEYELSVKRKSLNKINACSKKCYNRAYTKLRQAEFDEHNDIMDQAGIGYVEREVTDIHPLNGRIERNHHDILLGEELKTIHGRGTVISLSKYGALVLIKRHREFFPWQDMKKESVK